MWANQVYKVYTLNEGKANYKKVAECFDFEKAKSFAMNYWHEKQECIEEKIKQGSKDVWQY